MIRLNDINKTVIDETNITGYSKNDDSTGINLIISSIRTVFVEYNSYETRDKDIELLDKIFDVKNIEDYVYGRYPDETHTIESEVDKADKYITWGDVCQVGSLMAELPNGGRAKCSYNPQAEHIAFSSIDKNEYDGYIYSVDLFNALMLKKVE